MNTLFIYSIQDIESIQKPLASPEFMQFGISYVSAYLKKHGHNTRLLVLSRMFGKGKNADLIEEYIENFQPKLVCFTAVSSEYNFISAIAAYIKQKHKDTYLLIGGVHVSLNPEKILADNFDAVCIGEGEHPTLELIEHLSKNTTPTGILNLWIKNGSKIEKNPTRPFMTNLDSLPFPDRSMWSEWTDENPGMRHAVLLGRGCPFECTYCSNHALKKISSGQYVRLRTPDNIINEIKEISEKFPDQREIYLEIETFYVNKSWSTELCEKLEKLNKTLPKPLSFGVNLRISRNGSYNELFSMLKKSNFRFVNIGLESGSERIRSEILKRYYSNQDIINAVKAARQFGLQVAFFNIIGLPGETLLDFQETIQINRTCAPDWVMPSIFFPYPGTDLYEQCAKKGLLKKQIDTETERSRPILNLPDFPKNQIRKNYEWFHYNIYKGRKPRLKLFLWVVMMKLRSKPKLFFLYKKLIKAKTSFMVKPTINKKQEILNAI